MRINRHAAHAQSVVRPSVVRPMQCVIMWIMWCRVCPVGGARPFEEEEEEGARSGDGNRPADPFEFLH